jgi:hypothetical protein
MRRFRPFQLTLFGVLLILVLAWIGMSRIDYDSANGEIELQTAGWFLLGLPGLVGLGLLYTLPFSMVARSKRPVLAWCAMITTYSFLIGSVWQQVQPAGRLESALGVKIPPECEVLRLKHFDTFNAGIVTCGKCRVPGDFVTRLIEHHEMKVVDSGEDLKDWMPHEPIPSDGPVMASDELTCYFDQETRILYFHKQIGRRP